MKVFFRLIPFLARTFSGGSLLQALSVATRLYWFFFITRILKRTATTTIPVTYKACRTTFELQEYLDFAVLQEVFYDQEYQWFPIANPKYILDLGAHIGDTAIYYAGHFPAATIVAVEPDPDNYARLKSNTASVPKILPIQAAVGKKRGTISLYKHSGSMGSSTIERKGNSKKSVTVPMLTLTDLLEQQNIDHFDLIKFDIEGAEESLFPTGTAPQAFSQSYIGEYHEDLAGVPMTDFVQHFDTHFNLRTTKLSKAARYVVKAVLV
jgi:FkbM family methyltransferase